MEGLDAKFDGSNVAADMVKQSWSNNDDVSKVPCFVILVESVF